MTITKHIDELSDFHVKDSSKLTPGTPVLFGHVAPLDDHTFEDHKQYAEGSFATVIEVKDASFNELHGFHHTEAWATDKDTVMLYKSEVRYPGLELKRPLYRHLSDMGVNKYSQGFYNRHNFVVVLADLKAAGIQLDLEPSADYAERLEAFNAQIIEYPHDED